MQTAGPGSLNLKRATVFELGNYKSVGQVSDIPDLSFSMESLDVSCAMEALLLDVDVKSTHTYDLSASHLLNIKSAFKPGAGAVGPFGTVGSASVPCLRLESMAYKFGIGNADARQTATLKGDSLFYNPGSTYIQKVAGTAAANQTIVTTHPAYAVDEAGITRRTLAITAGNTRLLFGTDYTEAYAAITASAAVTTITILAAVAATDTIYVSYASPDMETFPQSVHALVSGVSGTLTALAAPAATTLSLSISPNAGDVIILDDVAGSAVTETAVVASVAAATLAAPVITTGVAAAGGTFAAGSYFWKLTAINAAGETIGSNEVTAALTLNQQQPINWTAIAGATGYKLYRGTLTGTENVLVATLGAVVTYTDTGTAGTAATVPVTNTSGVAPFTATLTTATVFAHANAATWAVYVPTVKPAAIRGRDIDIYVGPAVPGAANATAARGTKRHGLQAASVDWKVTLQNDEEMGSYHYVNIDFDVPVVSGSLQFMAQTVPQLIKLMQDLSGVTDPFKSANPTNSPVLDVQIVLKNPIDGRVLKRLWCSDARFSLPGYSGKVQQKLDFTAAFQSDQGFLVVADS